MAPRTITETWAALGTPNEREVQSAAHVRGTNAWVFKDSHANFGLMLTGVDVPGHLPGLKNIHIEYKPEKILERRGSSSRIIRCLEVTLNPGSSPEALSTVLDGLATVSPT